MSKRLRVHEHKHLQIGFINNIPIYHPDILTLIEQNRSASQTSSDSKSERGTTFTFESHSDESDPLIEEQVPFSVKTAIIDTSAPTLIIDLSIFLCTTTSKLDGLAKDSHADCEIT